MRRFLAYSYRDLSDSDLKHLFEFLESPAGARYVTAYNAAMGAGYDAMGKRTGEQLGESLRELAQAQYRPAAAGAARRRKPAAAAASPRPPRPCPRPRPSPHRSTGSIGPPRPRLPSSYRLLVARRGTS